MMTELSGIVLAMRVHEICPDCKVILISGHANAGTLFAMAREDGQSFPLLTKPVHPMTMVAKILSVLKEPTG
jgi:DNA-binding NtrC family response regulator